MQRDANFKMQGYLHYRGKKAFVTFWRKYYCVLSGRIVLFYTSQSAYGNLENYQRSLDLGLAYAVQPAPGVEHGIQVSTHVGPQWLRARDEESCSRWLDAFRRASDSKQETLAEKDEEDIVRQRELPDEETVQRRSRKALSINVVKENSGETNSTFKRVSLNFFPGHGRKYPTYDGRLIEPSHELDVHDETKAEDGDRGVAKRRVKKGLKKKRPESASVSDFLLLNSPTSGEAPASFSAIPMPATKRKPLQKPRIPTNKSVDKLVQHSGLNLTLSRAKKAAGGRSRRRASAEARPIRSMTSLHLAEEEYESFVKASSDTKVGEITGAPVVRDEMPPDDREKTDETPEENKKQQVKTELKTGPKKKEKPVRRKSSLAKLKHFLSFAIMSKKKEEPRERKRSKTGGEEEHVQRKTPHDENQVEEQNVSRKSWLLYQQQISEGNESVVEEPAVASKAFECDVNKEKEEPVPRRRPSGDSHFEPRQRKYSLHSCQARETRTGRPATRSFDFEHRASRTLDRKSTVRALDFNFDLTLDVAIDHGVALPVKTRVRASSPGGYDTPRTRCKHCSLPISLILNDVETRGDAAETLPPVPAVTVTSPRETTEPSLLRGKSGPSDGYLDGKHGSPDDDAASRLSFASLEVEVVTEETVDSLEASHFFE